MHSRVDGTPLFGYIMVRSSNERSSMCTKTILAPWNNVWRTSYVWDILSCRKVMFFTNICPRMESCLPSEQEGLHPGKSGWGKGSSSGREVGIQRGSASRGREDLPGYTWDMVNKQIVHILLECNCNLIYYFSFFCIDSLEMSCNDESMLHTLETTFQFWVGKFS